MGEACGEGRGRMPPAGELLVLLPLGTNASTASGPGAAAAAGGAIDTGAIDTVPGARGGSDPEVYVEVAALDAAAMADLRGRAGMGTGTAGGGVHG